MLLLPVAYAAWQRALIVEDDGTALVGTSRVRRACPSKHLECIDGRDGRPRALVTWPPQGYIGSETEIEVEFTIVNKPDEGLIYLLGTTLSLDYVSFVLSNLEPGTHNIDVTVATGPTIHVIFDIVQEPAPLFSQPSPWFGDGHGDPRLLFVGGQKRDGQKTIWLEQFKRLPFHAQYVTFLDEPEDFTRGLPVPFVRAPIPPISFEEAPFYSGQESLDKYLLENRDVDWVNRTWTHMINTMRGFDVVIFANARDLSDELLVVAAREAGAKSVMELPNMFPNTTADVMVAPSSYVAQHIPQAIVIHPGVDTEVFRRRRPSENIVGFVARLAPEKSPGLFVHAMALLRDRARFVIVGDGPSRQSIEVLAQLYDLPIEFTGAVDRDALPDIYASFSVLVNPTLRAWSETFCIVNVEALATETPIVSFAVGGQGDYLSHDTAKIVNSTDPQALADAVAALLDDEPERRRLATNGRRLVEAHFDVRTQMASYERLYRSLVP